MIDLTAWGNLIASVGFPIAIAVWLITQTSRDIRSLEKEIVRLRIAIIHLAEKMDIDVQGGDRVDLLD